MSSPKRGYSTRVRKPNSRLFDDYEDARPSRPKKFLKNSSNANESFPRSPSPKLTVPIPLPTNPKILNTPDKKIAQSIGIRLRNLLKLPKAHKWVCYEWFYSNIDTALFEGENDFMMCVRETFPELKTRRLMRAQWCKIRRLMGKPRRCSSAFFAEERAALQRKRDKIRLLQQQKNPDLIDFKDLPDEIPQPLVIGTKVTARLRKPQDGLFTGIIDAIDTSNNTYRITFDRPGLGTHTVLDVEVLSNEPQETIPLSAFQNRVRHRVAPLFSPAKLPSGISSPGLVSDNDPLLGGSPLKGGMLTVEGETYGGFPVKFLILVTKLSKILSVKKERTRELKDMNTQAEKMNSFGKPFDVHFQQKYANVVVELDQLNRNLNEYLVCVQQYCSEIAPEQGIPTFEQPFEIRQRCDEEATAMVRRNNTNAQNAKLVRNEHTLELVSKLTSLLLQIKTFGENNMRSFECRSIEETLAEIKSSLDPSNLRCFESNVEVHINHVQSGLNQMGNLHAFLVSSDLKM